VNEENEWIAENDQKVDQYEEKVEFHFYAPTSPYPTHRAEGIGEAKKRESTL